MDTLELDIPSKEVSYKGGGEKKFYEFSYIKISKTFITSRYLSSKTTDSIGRYRNHEKGIVLIFPQRLQ